MNRGAKYTTSQLRIMAHELTQRKPSDPLRLRCLSIVAQRTGLTMQHVLVKIRRLTGVSL